MIKFVTLIGMALIGLAPSLAEQPGFYAELGYAQFGIDVSDRDFDPGAVQLRGGYMFSPYFGVEAEAAIGAVDGTQSGQGTRLSVEVDQAIAAYLVGRWPVTDRIELIGRTGYQKIDISVEGQDAGQAISRQSGDGEGLVFGGGAEYQFGAFGVRADYTWASEASPFPSSERIETVSLSLTKAF